MERRCHSCGGEGGWWGGFGDSPRWNRCHSCAGSGWVFGERAEHHEMLERSTVRQNPKTYRRNSDVDLRTVERDWLVDSNFENLQRYVQALHRNGDLSRALNILETIINSNDRGELESMFKDQRLLRVVRDYSASLLRGSTCDVDYSGATISLRRNRKKRVLMPFWVINTGVDLEFEGEEYAELDKDDVDEDTEDEYSNSATTHSDSVTEYLDEIFNVTIIDTWELDEEDPNTWASEIDYDVEDENEPEDGYQIVSGDTVDFQTTEADELVEHIEELAIGDELTIRAAEVRDGDPGYKAAYTFKHDTQLQPFQLLAILVGFEVVGD